MLPLPSICVCCLNRGSALQRRLTEREKEMEADERDRQRERDELEEIRKKLVEEGHPDLESEMARVSSRGSETPLFEENLSDLSS